MREGHFDHDCLFSTVQNTSGESRVFGFLPPHGVRLAADAEYTVFGDVRSAVTQGDRVSSRRNHQAFLAAIDRGDLTIVTTPAPILQDVVSGATKMIRLSTTLSAVAPCWENSDSLDVASPA